MRRLIVCLWSTSGLFGGFTKKLADPLLKLQIILSGYMVNQPIHKKCRSTARNVVTVDDPSIMTRLLRYYLVVQSWLSRQH